MRHPLDEYRDQVHRGFSMPRALPSMLLMMAIVGMLMYNARNPNMWRFFAQGKEDPPEGQRVVGGAAADKTGAAKTATRPNEGKTALVPADGKGDSQPPPQAQPDGKTPAPEKTPLAPTGPTDEDPDEQDFMSEAAQAINDGSIETTEQEMAAYKHVLDWVRNQPAELLQQRAQKDVVYDRFIRKPDEMRFKLVELDMTVYQLIPVDPVPGLEGMSLYELRGFTVEGGSLLYMAVILDPPEGMPTGSDVREKARLVGYFFKTQGYYARESPPGVGVKGDKKGRGRPLKAPMFIGRVIWEPGASATKEPSVPVWLWATLAVVVIVACGGGVLIATILGKKRPVRRPLTSSSYRADPEAMSVDEWLDQAQTGQESLGNSFPDFGESSNGRADRRPDRPGNGKSRRFPGDYDTIGR
jgi:hypothetical protein